MGKPSLLLISSITFFILISINSFGALNVSLSDQGTEVKAKSTGDLLNGGNLTVTIYDALAGGNLVYNETFSNAINNGSWNVMLGENISNPLSLEFGRTYYKDYEINGENANFTNLTGGTIGRQFFYSPLGDVNTSDLTDASITSAKIADSTIVDADISDTTNLTLGEQITFTFGEVIDNIIDGFIRITGGLNVTNNVEVGGNLTATYFIGNGSQLTDVIAADSINGTELADTITLDSNMNVVGANFSVNTSDLFVDTSTGRVGIGTSSPLQALSVIGNANITGNTTVGGTSLTVNGTEVCLADGTNCQNVSLGFFVNFTSTKTTGNITNSTLNGYQAANTICDTEFPGTHMCQMHEILNTINDNRSIAGFGATFRASEGAPGFTANANDCDGWKTADGTALGSIWVGDTDNGGSGSLVACNANRAIGCCK